MFYQNDSFITSFIQLMQRCNEAILEIYYKDFKVVYKEDKSPLTMADEIANSIICEKLESINKTYFKENEVVIISEENKNKPYEERCQYNYCWLVDPIDGTKEFVKKNGQFTVNIGLCYLGTPVFGMVSIPVTGEIYYGAKGLGSFKVHHEKKKQLHVNSKYTLFQKNSRIVASSSHLNKETQEYIEQFPDAILLQTGSSLKLLYIAENKADIYPRIAPTSEWDTCAAHAILLYAGGKVFNYSTKYPLQYNKENLLNPFFIASCI